VPDLVDLARVKRFLNIADASKDTLLAELIVSVSQAARAYVGQEITTKVITDEYPDSLGQDAVVLRQGPIASVQEVRESNSVVAPADYAFEGRLLTRLSAGELWQWPQGRRVIKVNYTSGYAAVPEDFQLAACLQTAHLYHQSALSGQGRLGMQSKGTDAGGATSYLSDNWLPAAREILDRRREALPT